MRILIVEDNPEAAEEIRRAVVFSELFKNGIVEGVVMLPTIDAALTFLATEPGIFSIFLDHDLPEYEGDSDTGSGVRVAKEALKLDQNTPIIGISSVEPNNIHLENCGAFLSLPKGDAVHLMPFLIRACINWRRAMWNGMNPNLPIH